MARITVEDCVTVIPNRFELCLIASNRAKSILSGSNTNLDGKEKPAVIALREIAEGLVSVDSIKENIVNSIKNRGASESNINLDVKKTLDDETEIAVSKETTTFVDENLEVDD